jgi:hypothetical protein
MRRLRRKKDMYVIQERVKPWIEKYETLHSKGRFKTLPEAREAFEGLPKLLQISCRIAEEYTVTRYKAVK